MSKTKKLAAAALAVLALAAIPSTSVALSDSGESVQLACGSRNSIFATCKRSSRLRDSGILPLPRAANPERKRMRATAELPWPARCLATRTFVAWPP